MSQIYQCAECGLHYLDPATAKECEAFCREYQACSLDITRQSIEATQGAPDEV